MAELTQEERDIQVHRTLAMRLFKARDKVKGDFHWRARRRTEIRGHIDFVRRHEARRASSCT